tara:strand:+ start:2704 stop:4473 length:1770 start_codon:yes stop_codon:yes gene_type:complete
MFNIQKDLNLKAFDFKLLFKLIYYIKPYKFLFLVTVIISIVFGILSTARPLLIQYAFDNYILNFDPIGLWNIMLIIFLLLLIEAFFQFIFLYQSNYLAQKIIKIIRINVFNKIILFRVNYFDKTPIGQSITRVVSDIEAISSVFSQGLIVIFGDFFKISLIIVCMIIVDWRLALVSLLFLPFLIFSTIVFQYYMRNAFLEVRKYISKINIFLYEHILGMNIIQLFSKENNEFKIFKSINASHRDSHIKTVLYFSIFLPIVDMCSAIAMGLLVWYGAIKSVEDGTVTIGEIIAFILFVNMLFRPLRGIADRFNILQMGVVASRRVFDILDNNIEIEKIENNRHFTSWSNASIIFKNVKFYYKPSEIIFHDLNFSLKNNQTLAIVGPTGSGKTTIINLLMRWYNVSDGNIYVNGCDINTIPLDQLRSNIGVVLQDNFFLSDTLMNNIKFFNKISDEKVFNAVREVGLEDFINKFPEKYNYDIGERGSGLSAGEKQLISFLRTYLLNPTFLILDEATSSMDPWTENLIQGTIKNITKSRTSIIIAHRLSTVKDADKIIFLEDGNIVEYGDHNTLLKLNGKYANYYHQQFVGH